MRSHAFLLLCPHVVPSSPPLTLATYVRQATVKSMGMPTARCTNSSLLSWSVCQPIRPITPSTTSTCFCRTPIVHIVVASWGRGRNWQLAAEAYSPVAHTRRSGISQFKVGTADGSALFGIFFHSQDRLPGHGLSTVIGGNLSKSLSRMSGLTS